MKSITTTLLALITLAGALSSAETREFDYFSPAEISHPLVLPELFAVSKYGRGLYRIDSFEVSRGKLNCIFLTFSATAPEGTTATREQKWKTERIEVDGKPVVRVSAVLVNPFPREADPNGDVLVVRIDAASEKIAQDLHGTLDGFLPQ